MKHYWTTLLFSSGLASLAIVPALRAADAPAAAGSPNYHLLKEITIGGGTSWDYLAADADSHRLYVSHGTEIVIIDTAKDTVIGNITGMSGVHGIALAPKLNRGFISNGRANNVCIFDLTTLKAIQNVDTGSNPDAVLYEPTQKEVYAFNHSGSSATVFSAETGNLVSTIPLNGSAEFAQTDASTGRVYDNLEDKSVVVAIDIKTHKVVETWPLAPGDGPTGNAIDLANKHLFLGCDGNGMMVMLDYTTGKVVTTVPIGKGIDACSYDPATHFAFASGRGATGAANGTVTIARADGDKLTVVQTLNTLAGAKTMTLDTATHKIYLAAVKPNASAAATPGTRGPAGTFTIFVYGMDNPPAAKP